MLVFCQPLEVRSKRRPIHCLRPWASCRFVDVQRGVKVVADFAGSLVSFVPFRSEFTSILREGGFGFVAPPPLQACSQPAQHAPKTGILGRPAAHVDIRGLKLVVDDVVSDCCQFLVQIVSLGSLFDESLRVERVTGSFVLLGVGDHTLAVGTRSSRLIGRRPRLAGGTRPIAALPLVEGRSSVLRAVLSRRPTRPFPRC